MSLLADLLSTVFERRLMPWAAVPGDGRTLREMCADLLDRTGEVTGQSTARQILDLHATLGDDQKLAFYRHLATDLGVDTGALRAALDAYEAGQNRDSYGALMAASEPPRQELIRRLNRAPGGTGALVKMRADLLRLGRKDPELSALDLDFQHLFASWFNRGFLVLRPISWESPAHILEKIIQYEAVHAIDSWEDLRRRLEPGDRRCFAFFHPAMPDEPLIFVEVALTRKVPGSVQALLAEDRAPMAAPEADTAVFYSISNCQAGLAGISFGNSLIKQVAADLARELPGLTTFVTLSPIPGLMRWMRDQGLAAEAEVEDDMAMRRLAARYLTEAKRDDGLPLDPVARFHLGNGAQVHQVHARADLSKNGQAQSGGVMVNYLYALPRIAQNHERFVTTHAVAASSEIRTLSKAADLTPA
mgnify:CR=1 FL=1|jgi:malonyl-CoA decarboxylase